MSNLRNWLRRKNFAEDAIERVIQAFSETMELATPSEQDYNTGAVKTDGSAVPQNVKLGDYVQWEQSGVLQLPEARKVTWVSDDGKWLRVEGSRTGIPVGETRVTDAPKKPLGDFFTQMMEDFMGPIGPKPLSERLQVTSTGNQLRVAAVLFDAKEVERLVRILNANKELLADPDTASVSDRDSGEHAPSD